MPFANALAAMSDLVDAEKGEGLEFYARGPSPLVRSSSPPKTWTAHGYL